LRGVANKAITMAFQPGQSGNPSGRPKENAELKAAARAHTEAALAVLVAALEDEDAKTRITAANALLDRGYGKPTQAIGGDPDLPMQLEIGWRKHSS
jgi:HEAT repeat protein